MKSASDHTVQDFQGDLPGAEFLRMAELHAEKNAVWINGRYYTYSQLLNEVRKVYALIPQGKLTRIAVYSNDDVQTYASLLAVNLYGAAWIPLNNKYPVQRNKRIINDAAPQCILSSSATDLSEMAGEIPVISTAKAADAGSPKLTRQVDQPIAYILYTSGSTGEPKGVPVTQKNLHHFFSWYKTNYDFNSDDRFLQVYELSFDVSVFSFFMPLLCGACCYIVPGDGIRFVHILRMLDEHKITVLSMVPTILSFASGYLDELTFPTLRYSFFSGDKLYHHHAEQWSRSAPNAELHNFYGPTETTIVCTRYKWSRGEVPDEPNGIVPLGKPFEGMDFIIVDEQLNPADKGELCFSGPQVIDAYLNHAAEEQFFTYKDKRYYRTGDLASLDLLGNLLFHGRCDSQVKINGYRVELGEVEAQIRKLTGNEVVAMSVAAERGDNQLVAFIMISQVSESELKHALLKVLPAYMIPSRFIAVPEFRLTLNGKISKNELLSAL